MAREEGDVQMLFDGIIYKKNFAVVVSIEFVGYQSNSNIQVLEVYFLIVQPIWNSDRLETCLQPILQVLVLIGPISTQESKDEYWKNSAQCRWAFPVAIRQ